MSKRNKTSDSGIFGIDMSDNPGQRELVRLVQEDWRTTPVVFCSGFSGTGKTMISIAAALDLVMHRQNPDYTKIFYCREPQEVGKSLGFLPGDLDDKYGVYLEGLQDNLEHIAFFAKRAGMAQDPVVTEDEIEEEEQRRRSRGKRGRRDFDDGGRSKSKYASKRHEQNVVASLREKIECIPPQFVRGRSFQNAIIIVDEAQNMTLDTIQALITRIGQYTKMIFIGSTNQIDDPRMSKEDNDFDTAYKIIKEAGYGARVDLEKSERSTCAARLDKAFTEYKEAHPEYKRSTDRRKKS